MAKRAPNKYEEHLASQLRFAGYQFEREFRFHPKRAWRVDFFLPDYNLVVEVEGVKWRGVGRHQSAVGFTGDCEKYNTLTVLGYRLLRFTGQQVMGTAKRKLKSSPLMDSAIDVINQFILRNAGGMNK